MAARVNVKFVVSLAVVVAVVLAGTGLMFAFVQYRSGDRYVRLGDEAMARQDYDAADMLYSRAVGKESGNVDWLQRWREARENMVPETAPTYEQDYRMYVGGILKTLATVQRTNVEAHKEYLEAVYRELALGAGRQGWEYLIRETEFSLAFLEPEEPASLRRYRGLAVAALIEWDLRIDESLRMQGRDDLESALAEDPKDVMAARALAGWHRNAAARTQTDMTSEERLAHLSASRQVIANLLAAAPDHPLGLVDQLAMDGADVDLLEDPGSSPAEVLRRKVQALDQLRPRLHRVQQQLLAADPEDLNRTVVTRFFQVATSIEPENGASLTRAIVDHALQDEPRSADLLMIRAETKIREGDIEGSLVQLQQVAELPNLPVSLEGLRRWELRPRAKFVQAAIATGAAVQATDSATRSRELERAREFRRELTKHYHENSAEVMFIDGKLLFADGDLSGAQRTLAEFVTSPGGAANHLPEALLMLADAAIRRGTPGLAREYLQQIQESGSPSTSVLLARAQLERSLQNPAQAQQLYEEVLLRNPDHQVAREQLQLLRAMQGVGTIEGDEVMQRLVEADRLARGSELRMGDDEAAITLLTRSLRNNEYNRDPRLYLALSQFYLMRNDRAAAVQTIDEALVHHPEHTGLRDWKRQIQAAGSLELTLALIEESEAPELEKLLSRLPIYLAHGMHEEAKAALERAARLAADDARVIELQFMAAVQENNLPAAAALVERAARLDADRADGDTFRARLQLAEGNPRQAVITLQRAADRGNASAALFRLLGLTQLQLGRTTEGIASLRRAVELAPTDLSTIKTLLGALIQNNLLQEALAVARASEPHGRRDSDFMNLWMMLEASAGNVAFARERREQIAMQRPDDRENRAALAELYIHEKRFDRAREIIDSMRDSDSLRVVTLDARWHADRGDLEKAWQVFVEHITRLREADKLVGPEPLIAFGQFFLQRGQVEAGLSALRDAARLQDPKTRSVDIQIGDVLLQLGRSQEAEKMFRSVLDAGITDERHAIRKRLIEAQIQQNRYAEADREFGPLGTAADEDIALLVLRADVARGLGDTRRARELLDRAVARFPEEALGYLRRARLLMGDTDFARDAVADLTTALRLRPGMAEALRMRAAIHFMSGQINEALRDVVAAVEANPNMDNLRIDAMFRLLRHNREQEAINLARAGATLRPADRTLLTNFGDVFTREKRWRPASQFYGQAWEINPADEAAAIRYLQALIQSGPEGQRQHPQFAEAERVLGSPALQTNRSMDLMMMRAQLRRRQGQNDTARADALQAFSLAGENPIRIVTWYERLREVYPDPAAVMAVLDAVPMPLSLRDWQAALRATVMLDDPAMRSEGIATLQVLAAETQDVNLRNNAFRVLSSALAVDEQWEEALRVSRDGLAVMSDDPMLNNNVAFFLDKLDRTREGLPYAERAVAAAPDDPVMLDTLASLQWSLGQQEAAVQTLNRALRATQTDSGRASTALKLARWMLEMDDRTGALAMSQLIRDLLVDLPETDATLRSQHDELLRDLQKGR